MQVVKIPLGAGSLGKNKQTNRAPDEIEKAANEIFLSESGNVPVLRFEKISLDESDIEQAHKQVEQQAEHYLKQSTQPLCFLGGDHSLTYSTFRAFAKLHPSAGLLVIDAHPDLMQKFDPPSHENYLRCLIDDNIIDPKNIILIGIRAWDKEEQQFINQHNIKTFSMKKIAEESFKEIMFSVMEQARQMQNVYFSIDIDGVDPAFAPGTGYVEPGGISSRDLIHFIHKLKLLKNIRCYDLVEINPEKDVNNMTVKLGARILAELS